MENYKRRAPYNGKLDEKNLIKHRVAQAEYRARAKVIREEIKKKFRRDDELCRHTAPKQRGGDCNTG